MNEKAILKKKQTLLNKTPFNIEENNEDSKPDCSQKSQIAFKPPYAVKEQLAEKLVAPKTEIAP